MVNREDSACRGTSVLQGKRAVASLPDKRLLNALVAGSLENFGSAPNILNSGNAREWCIRVRGPAGHLCGQLLNYRCRDFWGHR